jgi:hypothetical protein
MTRAEEENFQRKIGYLACFGIRERFWYNSEKRFNNNLTNPKKDDRE